MEDIKKLSKLMKDIKQGFKKRLNRNTYKKLAKEIRVDIQERVQKGYGLTDMESPKKKFKNLDSKTIAIRRRMKEQGKLSPKTAPGKSNQIATGEMVDNLKERTNKDGFSIEIDKKRQKVYEAQEDTGRGWLYLSKDEAKKVDETVEDAIEDTLDNLFND